MMACEQYTAPNGQPSNLASWLIQQYGNDATLRIWSYLKSPEFQEKYGEDLEKNLDANGDLTSEFVKPIADVIVSKPDTTEIPQGKQYTISSDKLQGKSLEGLTKTIDAIVDRARKNPNDTFTLDLDSRSGLYIDGKKLAGLELARYFNRPDMPQNVRLSDNLQMDIHRLPESFMRQIVFEDSNPLKLDEASKKREMDSLFVQVRDNGGKPTGEYFNSEKQKEAVNTVRAQFYKLYNELSGNPELWENAKDKAHNDNLITYIRRRILNTISNRRTNVREILDNPEPGDPERFSKLYKVPESEVRNHMNNIVTGLDAVINSYYIPGERNSIWNFFMDDLERHGIQVDANGQFKEPTLSDALPEDETEKPAEETEGDFMEENGQGLRDWSQNFLSFNMKNTAGVRMKMLLMTIPDSELVAEPVPDKIDMHLPKVVNGWLGEGSTQGITSYVKKDFAKKNNFWPLQELGKYSDADKKRLSQRSFKVDYDHTDANGVRTEGTRTVRVIAVARTKEGDIQTVIEPFIPNGEELQDSRNFFGFQQIAEFETLWNGLTSYLSNREPSVEGYIQALKESSTANHRRVAEKLDSAPEHVRKEFTSVMSTHYNKELMVLFQKSRDGFLQHRVIDSNRGSELEVLKNFWREQQKRSPIMTTGPDGRMMVNREKALDLYNRFQERYQDDPAMVKKIQDEWNEDSKHMDKLKAYRIAQDKMTWLDRKGRAAWAVKRAQLMQDILESNGIHLHPDAFKEENIRKALRGSGFDKGRDKDDAMAKFWGDIDEKGPHGVLAALVHRLAVVTEQSEATDQDAELFKANNPLYSEGKALNVLAKMQLPYTSTIQGQSHRDSEGKTIYSYGLNNSLTHAARKNGQEVVYMDGLRNEYGTRGGVPRQDMSPREQWLMALSLFQHENDTRGHFISLTHSDKTQSPIFPNVRKSFRKTDAGDSIAIVEIGANGLPRPSQIAVDKVREQLFDWEYNRALQPGGEGIKSSSGKEGYAEGKGNFYFLPKFNRVEMEKLVKEGVLTEGEMKSIWIQDEEGWKLNPTSRGTDIFNKTVDKLIRLQLDEIIQQTIDSWHESKLIDPTDPTTATLPGRRRYYDAWMKHLGYTRQPGDYSNWYLKGRKLGDSGLLRIREKVLATDYGIESLLFNAGLSQKYYGDPALFFKKDIRGTLVEYGKRLAKDIAPGLDGDWSHAPTYKTLTVTDYEPGGGINGSDAQAITTVKEHLNVLYAHGRITDKQWKDAMNIIREATGGYYSFKEKIPHLHNLIMQPMKPVVAGLGSPVGEVRPVDYVKFSSYPLYPPATQGFEIDKLRAAMEHPEHGVDRIDFISARKAGTRGTPLKVFKDDGTVNEEVLGSELWKDSQVTMDRSSFRIQQEVPYDEDKHSVLTVSQLNKNITESIQMARIPFKFGGKELSGQELRLERERIRKELIGLSHQRFLDKVGGKMVTDESGNATMQLTDKKKLWKLLAQEARTRSGYSLNDILALRSYMENSDDLKVPLYYLPSASKMERMMMSLVGKIVKIKVPGHSFVQASPAGFRTLLTWEGFKEEGTKHVGRYDFITDENFETGDQIKLKPGVKLTDDQKRKIQALNALPAPTRQEAIQLDRPLEYNYSVDSNELEKYQDLKKEIADLAKEKEQGKNLPGDKKSAENLETLQDLRQKVVEKLGSKDQLLLPIIDARIVRAEKGHYVTPKLLSKMVELVGKFGKFLESDSKGKRSSQLAKDIYSKHILDTMGPGSRSVTPEETSGSNQDNLSQVVWTAPFSGELQTARKGDDGTVHAAQVLVSAARFRALTGEDISVYTKDEGGKKVLDMERIPRELLQMVAARIPNQGHSSSLPLEIAGFLPEQMGDIVIVPADITRQMGSDFDVDKLFTYNRVFKKDGDRFVPEDGLEEAGAEDALKNQYFDLHWSVLTHPEVFDVMMQPLDKNDLKQEAAKLTEEGDIPYYFTPAYQLKEFQSMKDAKILVAMQALSMSSNAELQDRSLTLRRLEVVGGGEKASVPAPILFLSPDEKLMKTDRISGSGQSTYNGEVRTKSDNIGIGLNEAVDHAKNRVIDKVNLNPYTFPAWQAITKLQTPDQGKPGKPGFVPGQALSLDYATRLMAQPIIKDYVARMAVASDTINPNYTIDPGKKVIEDLKTEYIQRALAMSGKTGKDAMGELIRPLVESGFLHIDDLGEAHAMVNPERLAKTAGEPRTPARVMFQTHLLDLFEELTALGKQISDIGGVINRVTRGAEGDMLSALRINDRRNKLGTPNFSRYISGVDSIFSRREEATEVGVTYDSTIPTALGLFKDDLPFQSLNPLYVAISDLGSGAELSTKTKSRIFSAFKSYVMSKPELGLFPDAEAERMRLGYSTDDSPSLALRVQEAQTGWGRSNVFLQRLHTVISPDGLSPDLIEYYAAKAPGMKESEDNTRYWLDMIHSENPEISKLGEDLIRWAYATGGVQGARNYIKFVPWSVIEGGEIAPALREAHLNIDGLARSPNLLEQIIQHYPGQARQLSPGMEETGQKYVVAPDSFWLPYLDAEALSGNPAEGLVQMGADGNLHYPDYLSYREGNKWRLYKRREMIFADRSGKVPYDRLDTLGGNGISEFNAQTGEMARSMFPENRAPWFIDYQPAPFLISNLWRDVHYTPEHGKISLSQIGLFEESGTFHEIENALTVIANDERQPSHLRVLAELLGHMERNPHEEHAERSIFQSPGNFRWKLEEIDGVRGRFVSGRNELMLNPAELPTRQDAAEALTHELMHRHLALLATAAEGEARWAEQGYNEGLKRKLREVHGYLKRHPELMEKFRAVEEIRRKALEEWDKRSNREGLSSDYRYRISYGLSSLNEFLAHTLSDGHIMKFLDSIDYQGTESPHRTVLERIKDLFTQIWQAIAESLGARSGSLLEESVKRTLDLLTYDKIGEVAESYSETADGTAMYSNLKNASASSPVLDRWTKVIGKLKEEKNNLAASMTAGLDPKVRMENRRKMVKLEEQIKEMQADDGKNLELVKNIGAIHTQWVRKIADDPNANYNQINTAIRLGKMWQSISDDILKGSRGNLFGELPQDTMHKLISKGMQYWTEEAKGFLKATDWEIGNIKDPNPLAVLTRTLSSTAKSKVIQHIAGFIETVGQHEHQEVYQAMHDFDTLNDDMKKYAGSKGKLKELTQKIMRTDGWGLRLRYSQQYFDWRESLIRTRNGKLNAIDRSNSTVEEKNARKRKAWLDFWEKVDKSAAYVDTRKFFDPRTGEFLPGIESLKKELGDKVGEENLQWLLDRAQKHYKAYINDRENFRSTLEAERDAGEITQQQMDEEMSAFQNRESPNVFFDHKNRKKTFSAASERYIALAPLKEKKEFWDEGYNDLMAHPEERAFYERYSALIDQFKSYLPQSLQDQAGPGFLPRVRRAVMEANWNIPEYLKTMDERFVKAIGASEWKEDMNDRDLARIPIDYVKNRGENREELSENLIGIGKLFAMMAVHYRHFSAARDQVDMAVSILKEVNAAQLAGGVQEVGKDGQLRTVNRNISNSLRALEYMQDYLMFKKSRRLEGNSGVKIYSKQEEKGTSFSLLKQNQFRREVRELLDSRDKLESDYGEGKISEEEFEVRRADLNEKIAAYQPYTIYGSKLGDKLITLNQLKVLSYNPFSAVANIAFGWLSMGIHAAGGRDFSREEMWRAWAFVNKLPMERMGGHRENSEKFKNVMDKLGVLGDYVDTRYGKSPEVHSKKSLGKKLLDPYSMLRGTDFNMKGTTALAVMLHQKVDVVENGEKKTITLWDAMDENGEWDEKRFGKNPLWKAEGYEDIGKQEEWDKLVNRIRRVNMILHGNQDKNAPKLYNKYVLGRLIAQFRGSWLPEGWAQRFGDEHYDEFLGRSVEGRYRSMTKLGFGATLSILGKELLNYLPGVHLDLSSGLAGKEGRIKDPELYLENMRRNAAEIGMFLTFTAAVMMLKHLHTSLSEDDEDSLSQFALHILINQLIRGTQDIDFYTSSQVASSVLQDVIPAGRVISDLYNIGPATQKLLLNDDYTFGQWVLKMTKAGIPIPQANQINKWHYMATGHFLDARYH